MTAPLKARFVNIMLVLYEVQFDVHFVVFVVRLWEAAFKVRFALSVALYEALLKTICCICCSLVRGVVSKSLF